MLKATWQTFEISPDQTHHVIGEIPAYPARFLSVLKFHEPGLAPVQDLSGAYHIDTKGNAAYANRFIRTFGFYELRAAVQATEGWTHILTDGTPLYIDRYSWCGNFQQHHSPVKDMSGCFFHIKHDGQKAYSASFKYVGDFKDGYAVSQDDDGLSTHIDFHGNALHNQKFLDLDVFHKGFARARDPQGWFHIDSRGRPLYPKRYKNIEPFYNGIARVETIEGALLLINELGEPTDILREPLEDPFHAVLEIDMSID
jgi:hypothetical protein